MAVPVPVPKFLSGTRLSGLQSSKNGLGPDQTELPQHYYPMSPIKQKELDDFLKENLSSGHICPSKSPMASPVFFVKKKDGKL